MSGGSPPTPLSLPRSLPYPITIQRLNKPVGAEVKKTDSLFTYSFKQKKVDEPGEERLVRVWESPVDGELVSWEISEGQKLTEPS